MKVLVLYDYPPSPGGLATQGDLLYRGLKEIGVDVHGVNPMSMQEKEWYYRWFKPDVVVGIGYWGHTPMLIQHPMQHGMKAVPWLVADGYIANYQYELNALPLILVTSNWVKEMYVRDGIKADNIHVLPVGCDTDTFVPFEKDNPKVIAVREALGVSSDELMILTVGGDAASKGGREVMEALAEIKQDNPKWKYICKVWPQPRTDWQNKEDRLLAEQLGIADRVLFATSIISRTFVPYLLGASDIYAAPSRLEGFGMLQVEAGACGKPVIGINAMGMLDTLVHGETAFLAGIAEKIVLNEVNLGPESGFAAHTRVIFDVPRTVDYRADIEDVRQGLLTLMNHPALRKEMGAAGRKRVVDNFDYRLVAQKFVSLINEKLDIY
ncbi:MULTISPECIES: glycosyltransferase family 4 protein [Pedobacter]|uniref:Glycosyl transferase group 1 n=1 Tax=Pedobacter heparinus (strain ATCC 13125 / DSM 2366 / CIP 104194 / JCM 7457 / NBRC 12017 / NCIMB 9290 / NRRL B-14731 / HIM 762-3) TaxID=485917 RepID=C6XTW3_PEDHD|nr:MULTISPECIES: glycosyltransferase family 4 protein [Pedobacter]ACU03749.1 glycosyl transferase group 1 [Pedobacter heparinus DSM 2366]MBB5436730.1 glycosyltransferase involved in cell wall biosynthesis [Pedobacter sp. AK017]